MKPARIVFPGFWFGESSLQEAQELARRGVGGFCVYGGTAEETRDFTRRMTEASPYGRLLFCADIDEDLSEIVTDAPSLPSNSSLKNCPLPQDGAYRKGNLLARMARSMGLDWVLAPVVDLGYAAPAFGDVPLSVTHLAGDFIAGLSNGGALNCIKYFPGGVGRAQNACADGRRGICAVQTYFPPGGRHYAFRYDFPEYRQRQPGHAVGQND